MKSLFYTLVFIIFSINLSAQPDLSCSYLYNNQKSMYRGDYLSLQFKIKNTGTSIASKSHSSIYLIDSITNTSYYLSNISTEAINSGDSSSIYSFIYPIPYNLSDGTKYIKLVVNANSEITESNTANNISYCTNKISIIPSYYINRQNLPYPVILMHGWCGKDTSWYSFLRDIENYYGYSYGGNLDFCLNQDGDFNKANLTNDIKDWTDTNKLYSGDFYTINFDIDSSGTIYAKSNFSNQSAAIKQGIAMKKAIQHVLNVTGKEKVILVAHSMGGLASREYLQNLTQSDGRHHVAKLFTIGTPHGGSNSTSANLTALVDHDERSDAVRDLRRTYDISGDSGVYLYGGTESFSVMNNSLLHDYYNADVNCNGYVGNNIIGLNHKSIPTDLSYSCVIGYDTYFPGLCSNCDGVVGFTEANINNYYPQVNADTFFCTGSGPSLLSGGPWHVKLPEQTGYILRGMDESDTKANALNVELNAYHFGNLTQKNAASSTTTDSDYYKFTIPAYGSINTKIYNIPTGQFGVKVIDSSTNTTIFTWYANGKGSLSLITNNLKAGTYYLNLYATPDVNTWYYPYAFRLNYTIDIPIAGKTITPLKKSIQNVLLSLSGDSSLTIKTDSLGSYKFDLSKIGNYKVTATKNSDLNKANGITTLDIALLQSHILQKTVLNNPYKIIAGDVNGDGKLSTLDIVYMKRLILGIDTTFSNSVTKNNRLWVFIDSSYKFPDSTNPFPFKDSLKYSNLNLVQNNQTLIGVKLGDLNWDWNPSLQRLINYPEVLPVTMPLDIEGNIENINYKPDSIRQEVNKINFDKNKVSNKQNILNSTYKINYQNTNR